MNATYEYKFESTGTIGELNAALDAKDSACKAFDQATATMKAAHLAVREAKALALWLADRKVQNDDNENTSHLMRMVNEAASVAATEARATVNRARITYYDACTSYEMLAKL